MSRNDAVGKVMAQHGPSLQRKLLEMLWFDDDMSLDEFRRMWQMIETDIERMCELSYTASLSVVFHEEDPSSRGKSMAEVSEMIQRQPAPSDREGH